MTTERRWIRQHTDELRYGLGAASSIEEKVELARANPRVCSNQKYGEILGLLKELRDINPQRLCEIGTDRGGTLALFAAIATPNARLLSLDLLYPLGAAKAYPRFARNQQRITCLEADSHSPRTVQEVQKWLAGQPLDFLFIDGDHSYEGVKVDFELFAPLVRSGGIIAFHDIVPDFWTRFGKRTEANVGEVPRSWAGLRSTMIDWREFIEDPEQDGYGIGMVRVPS